VRQSPAAKDASTKAEEYVLLEGITRQRLMKTEEFLCCSTVTFRAGRSVKSLCLPVVKSCESPVNKLTINIACLVINT
jgi:hypothetical protein